MDEADKEALDKMLTDYGTDGVLGEIMNLVMAQGGAFGSRDGAKALIKSSIDDA